MKLNERLKAFWEKVKTFLGKVSKKIWIVLAVVLILAAAAIAFFLNNRPYATLITGATNNEMSAIVTWLNDQGVQNYRMEGDGTILVPENQAANLKARLLTEKYSGSNSSYSAYFENINSLSTQSVRDKAWLTAVQDQFNSVIRQMDGVRDAWVTLTPGTDLNYILDSNRAVEASASILVEMQNGQTLDNKVAAAIRNYVAHGYQKLEVSSISLTDTFGNGYNVSDLSSNTADADASALKLRLEQEQANKIRTEVFNMLRPFFGEDNIAVGVNCVVNVENKIIDDYDVRLPEYAQDGSTNGMGIIGRRIYNYEFRVPNDTAAGGLVGTPSNADLPTMVEQEPGANDVDGRLVGGGDVTADNSKTQTHIVQTAGYLADCSVAVSINSTTAGEVNIPQIRQHVATAAGIEARAEEGIYTAEEYLASKISVVSLPFYVEPTPPGPGVDGPGGLRIPLWAIIALGVGLLVFILLLVLILSLRRRRKRKKEEEQRELEAQLQAALPPEEAEPGEEEEGEPTGADVMAMHTEKSMELRQEIRNFVDENPEIAALLLKGWMKGDDRDG